MAKFLTSIFGSRNDRLLKQYRKTVARINAMEPEYEKLSDEALRGKTQEFKERIAQGETLDALLPDMTLDQYAAAMAEAEARGIAAKAVTPFLLQRIFELTGGRSLDANIALVLNNARLAARIATAMTASVCGDR